MSKSEVVRYQALVWVVGITALGCDSFGSSEPPILVSGTGGTGVVDFSTGGGPFVTAPTDTRPAVVAAEAPPPVTGGTLLVTSDGKGAVVADPDRDRISFVDLERMVVTGTIELGRGDMPGRLVEGTDGHVYGVLRGRGSVLTLDRSTSTMVESRDVCLAPRGIAYDAAKDRLLVACAEGNLVELGQTGAVTRSVFVAEDLRDVVVTSERVAVSRFRSAELIDVDQELQPVQTQKPPDTQGLVSFNTGEFSTFEASVAWRTVAASDGSIFMSHQRATSATVEITPPTQGSSSAYGGGDGSCTGIVQTGFTRVTSTGLVGTGPQLSGLVLPVDIAISPERDWMAIATAGTRDPMSPQPGGDILLEAPIDPNAGQVGEPQPAVFIVDPNVAGDPNAGDCMPMFSIGTAPTTSVAINPVSGDLLVQVREPSQLIVMTQPTTGAGTLARIALNGGLTIEEDSRYDTGHELFHRSAGAGLACASCHPEGLEDGRVWNFSDQGQRRTQYLRVGLEGTAPFHWDGALADLGALMEEVMVGRMGGAHQTLERNDALAKWMFAMPVEAPLGADAAAAERGKVLFEDSAGCSACHTGPKLTNNKTVDVGTGASLQVPSLVGVSRHPPFMHNGCAKTLTDRFNPTCGGTAHGETAALSPDQIADLVSYLQTL